MNRKQSTLFLLITFLNNPIRSDRDDTLKWAAIISTTAVATGTGVYLTYRETNETKINRAHLLCQFYTNNVRSEVSNIETLSDMIAFTSQSAQLKKEITIFSEAVGASYQEMNARYGSWVKPWNWTSQMKDAFNKISQLKEKMRIVMMMFRYQQIFVDLINNSINEHTINARIRAICQGQSSYPLCAVVKEMENDVRFLYKNSVEIHCDTVIAQAIEKVITIIRGSAEYVEEKRALEEMELKRRQVQAEEEKAKAQMAQAHAQFSQAHAAHERNRIEDEKEEQRKKEKEKKSDGAGAGKKGFNS